MNREDRQRANQIFLKALERAEEERHVFVKTACGSEGAVCEAVFRLLNNAASAAEFFEKFEDDLLERQANELEEHDTRGFRLGNYELIHLIAQGGMGSVFLAKRADGQFDRRVVVKMLPMGFDSQSLRERFSKEQKILANLQHPNIAQLYDAGVTVSGRGYFVMEYVRGSSIAVYCKERKLAIHRRLDLFLELLAAVRFAHQKLVVHQDIKPSNVMVDRDGKVKLLDFGIAKTFMESHIHTKAGEGDYSRSHATPEQLSGEQISTASDIHQLGQLLFELLTDTSPCAAGMCFISPGQRVLHDWYARQTPQQLEQWAANRRLRTGSVKKALTADMDAIVSRAMMKDPQLRYASVQDFARDIQDMTAHRPVFARQGGWAYRLGKGFYRMRYSIAVVFVLLIGSIVFAGFMAWQSAQTEKQRDKALLVTDLLVQMFEIANPKNTPGPPPTIAEVLVQGAEKISLRNTRQHEVQADLLEVIGRTQQSLGNYVDAEKTFSRALAIRETDGDDALTDTARLFVHLGENARLLGKYAEAEKILRQALQQIPPEQHQLLANAQGKFGRVLVLEGKYAPAREYLTRAMELQLELTGEGNLAYAQSLNDLASIGFAEGKYAEAEGILRRALKIREQLGPQNGDNNLDPDYATNLNNLGLALFRQGKLEAAEPLFRRAVILRGKIYTRPHAQQAQSLTSLGLLLDARGRTDEAATYLQQALSIRKQVFGNDHMRVAESLNNLGMLHLSNARFRQALELYGEALRITIDRLGADHGATAIVLNNMGQAHLELGNIPQALKEYRRSLEIREKTLPEEHLFLSYSQLGLGRTLTAQGKHNEAVGYLRQALSLRENKLPKDHWLIGEARFALAEALLAEGKKEEARYLAVSAQDVLYRKKGKDHYLSRKAAVLLNRLAPGAEVAPGAK